MLYIPFYRLIQLLAETHAGGPEWLHTLNTWNYTCFDIIWRNSQRRREENFFGRQQILSSFLPVDCK